MPRDRARRKLVRIAGRHLWAVVQVCGKLVRRSFWISPARTIGDGELLMREHGAFLVADGDEAPPDSVLLDSEWQRWGGEPIQQDGLAG
ncbi:MAG: hypothetical protein IOC54_09905 [Methylobacterium sp.]|nr:hypothetical protein [Methylobacterium sp.]MCA4921976.1 hypothetical protein [Methylobacterium sp.]